MVSPERLHREARLQSLRALAKERDEFNQLSPEIPRPVFVRVRRGVLTGENSYAVDRPQPVAVREPS